MRSSKTPDKYFLKKSHKHLGRYVGFSKNKVGDCFLFPFIAFFVRFAARGVQKHHKKPFKKSRQKRSLKFIIYKNNGGWGGGASFRALSFLFFCFWLCFCPWFWPFFCLVLEP
jgi:hypothetical protein